MHILTQGKLISMALRCDHAFMLYSDNRKQKILDQMLVYWNEFVANGFEEPSCSGSDKWRAWQEATGHESFWSQQNDQSYVDSFERNKGRIYTDSYMQIIYGDE